MYTADRIRIRSALGACSKFFPGAMSWKYEDDSLIDVAVGKRETAIYLEGAEEDGGSCLFQY